MTGGPLSLVAGYVPLLEPTYADDFWSKPGYLGTDPTSSVAAARIQHPTTIVEKLTDPNRIVLETMPDGDLTGIDFLIGGERSPDPAGQRGGSHGDDPRHPGRALRRRQRRRPGVARQLVVPRTADVPPSPTCRRPTCTAGTSSARAATGEPIYPQRKILVGPIGAVNGSGFLNTGQFKGKMIVLESLVDIEALPWQADWYARKVEQSLGKQGMQDNYRLYFTDNAQHGFPAGPPAHARTVSYRGVLEQALRDLSAWVERGVAPPASTNYEIVDSQVVVPPDAATAQGCSARRRADRRRRRPCRRCRRSAGQLLGHDRDSARNRRRRRCGMGLRGCGPVPGARRPHDHRASGPTRRDAHV